MPNWKSFVRRRRSVFPRSESSGKPIEYLNTKPQRVIPTFPNLAINFDRTPQGGWSGSEGGSASLACPPIKLKLLRSTNIGVIGSTGLLGKVFFCASIY